MRLLTISMALFMAAGVPQPGFAQVPQVAPALTYADLADLALPATLVAHVAIDDADRLSPEESPGVPAGYTRFYVEADVITLVRGPSGFPARVQYLVDLPNTAEGRAPRLRGGSEHLVLARPVPGRPGEISLVARDAQVPFSQNAADRLRGIVREAVASDAPPPITGIGKAFHVPGILPGESDTRIFLLAADGRPLSLQVSRRSGQAPKVGIALTDMVEDAAPAPAEGTLLWYRLACTLPVALPAASLSEVDEQEAEAIRDDYAVLLRTLGTCTRSRRS